MSTSPGEDALSFPVWSRALLSVLVLGVGLRLVQWLANPSLWLDELQLVRNILDRSIAELFLEGLSHGQVAPVGFLVPTKILTMAFGDGELVLRAVPFLASILGLLLFCRLARGVLGPAGAVVACTAFALNPLLISLGSVVKQYETDVLATVIILVVFRYLRESQGSLRRRSLAGAGAGLTGLLSIAAVVPACAAIVVLVTRYWIRGKLRAWGPGLQVLLPLLIWATLSFGAALWAQALADTQVDFMHDYWSKADAFAPPFSEYPTWVLQRWSGKVIPELLLLPYIGEPGAIGSFLVPHLRSMTGWIFLLTAFTASAAALAALKGFGWALAVILPFPIAVVLSRLAIYPMDGRTSIFLLPLILLLVAAPASWVVAVLPRRYEGVSKLVPLVLASAFALILVDRPPIYVVKQDRAVIRELAERRAPEEPVFAHPWAASALSYYGPRFGLQGPIVLGSNQTSLREDLQRLAAFRGQSSLWVIFTHSFNRDLLLCYLDELGVESERVVFHGGYDNPVSLHRYDLSKETVRPPGEVQVAPLTDEAFVGDPPRCLRQDWSS